MHSRWTFTDFSQCYHTCSVAPVPFFSICWMGARISTLLVCLWCTGVCACSILCMKLWFCSILLVTLAVTIILLCEMRKSECHTMNSLLLISISEQWPTADNFFLPNHNKELQEQSLTNVPRVVENRDRLHPCIFDNQSRVSYSWISVCPEKHWSWRRASQFFVDWWLSHWACLTTS